MPSWGADLTAVRYQITPRNEVLILFLCFDLADNSGLSSQSLDQFRLCIALVRCPHSPRTCPSYEQQGMEERERPEEKLVHHRLHLSCLTGSMPT